MTITDKIRKRIRTIETAKGEMTKEIQITKEEAEQLGDRKVIDNVKLITVDKLGDITKKDCFGYIEVRKGHKRCYGLKNLYCKNVKCKFYRTDLTKSDIERDIRNYAEKYKRRTNEIT